MVTQPRKKLAVLISGRGSNMEAILSASKQDDYGAEIALVLSDNQDAKGLETALQAGIKVMAIPREGFSNKASHEQALIDAINQCGCDYVVLAGYMRLLSSKFVDAFEGRLINIHPSLLPQYKGLDTHQRAIADGVKTHGCTVHFVNEEMDGGTIIAQAIVEIHPHDDEDALSQRVLVQEHKLYSWVIHHLAKGNITLNQDFRISFHPSLQEDENIDLFTLPLNKT